MPTRKPLRYHRDKGWQILDDAQKWIECSRQDAELIAEYESLCDSVFAGQSTGEAVAERLDAMADVLERNVGRGTAERYCRLTAARARGQSS